MNNIDRQYKELSYHILNFGIDKADRTGTGTKSTFGWQIRHNMKDGFPLLTTKKMAWKSIVTELLWFLRGDTNIKFLVDNGCHVWDGDAYKRYYTYFDKLGEGIPHTKEEFIDKIKTDEDFEDTWGDLGPIYGKQWRSWNGKPEQITNYKGGEINPYFCDCQEGFEDGHSKVRKKNKGIDQIANLISELKTNPDSRRLMVSAWNVADLPNQVLPPCHYGFQVYTRELSLEERTQYKKKRDGIARTFAPYTHQMLDGSNIPTRAISLMWNQRSVDTFLGLPFNIASYGLLLEIIAKEVNMIPEDLIGNLGDVHLYNNHIEQAKEQLTRTPYELPKLVHMKTDQFYKSLSDDSTLYHHLDVGDFIIENYQSHPSIKAPLSN
jgi:thymidylate synthase